MTPKTMPLRQATLDVAAGAGQSAALVTDMETVLDVLWRRGDRIARAWIRANYPRKHEYEVENLAIRLFRTQVVATTRLNGRPATPDLFSLSWENATDRERAVYRKMAEMVIDDSTDIRELGR